MINNKCIRILNNIHNILFEKKLYSIPVSHPVAQPVCVWGGGFGVWIPPLNHIYENFVENVIMLLIYNMYFTVVFTDS